MSFSYVLVTGGTGLVGAHVVDNLLNRGIRVRAVARSKAKAERMLQARPQHANLLDFSFIDDLTSPGAFDEAAKGIDGVIHIASPYTYDVADNEKELLIPAVQGVRSILDASAKNGIRRIVMTSSFGAVLDMGQPEGFPRTYSSKDWNPITYSEAADPKASPQDAYRGSKVFAEQEAWNFVKTKKPSFDLVTLCPSMIFGPVATPVTSAKDLNESNAILWRMAIGGASKPLPPARFNFWIDVRDLAEIHVRALLTPGAGGKRYLPVAPEKFNYQLASEIILENFPSWAEGKVPRGQQDIKEKVNVDMNEMSQDFPNIKYKTFKETVTEFIRQVATAEGL